MVTESIDYVMLARARRMGLTDDDLDWMTDDDLNTLTDIDAWYETPPDTGESDEDEWQSVDDFF